MTAPQTAGSPASGRQPYLMLGMAAAGFAVTSWAWALLPPLGAHFKQLLGLTSFQQALLVAVPVIVGALGRIPVVALTDRYGGRIMFPVVSFATIVPVLFLGLAGYRACMKWGEQYPAKRDLSSLRLLGSVREPINPRPGCGTTWSSA